MRIYFVLVLSFFNGASVQAARVLLALYALTLGAQPVTVGVLAGMFSVFPMLLAVAAGRLADRFGSLWLIVLGAMAAGVGMLIAYLFPGLPAVFAAGAMMGFSLLFFNLCTQNLVGLLSAAEDRARNYSNYSLVISIANFVGPLFAGFSIDHSGHALACLYVALFSVAPVALMPIWGRSLPAGASHVERTGGGVKAMLSEPGVRRTLISGSLQMTGESLYQFYMPVYAHALGLSASAIGIVLAMYSAAAFAIRLALPGLIAWLKVERLLSCAFFVGAASLLVIPVFKSTVMLGLMSFVFGLGMGCCGPIVTMLMFGNAPAGRSGEALGLKVTANHFAKLVTPIVFGSIASAFGLFPVFWINALMLGTGGVISRPRNK
jgi:MFS family permease